MTAPLPLTYAQFDPTNFAFPKPRISILPLRIEYSTARHSHALPVRRFVHFSRGRYALHGACCLSGVSAATAILVPSYHCRSMIDPGLDIGAEIVLYPIDANFSPREAGLDRALRSAKNPVKALIAAHFFGISQDFTELAKWCRQRGISLIEDCSHTLFTETAQAAGVGHFGDFVVSSPYKFFPCTDGGLLYAARTESLNGMTTAPQPVINEVRGIKHLLESALALRRRIAAGDQSGDPEKIAKLESMPGEEQVFSSDAPSSTYDSRLRKASSLRLSRFIYRHTDVSAIAARRRRNYVALADGVADIPNCTAVAPEISSTCIPYMFPLLIEMPSPHFFRLKYQGVPIWRWDSMAVSDCEIARKARLHLLHLPCHQDINDEDLAWMINTLRTTLLCS